MTETQRRYRAAVAKYGSVRAAARALKVHHSTVARALQGDYRKQSKPFERLVKLVGKKPRPFEEVCDELNLSPRATRELLAEAADRGIYVGLTHGHVGFKDQGPAEIQQSGIAPVVGRPQKVAVISDTHLGSMYCMRAQIRDFIEYAYSQGVREILHPGDVLDGCYTHGLYELTHVGLEQQCRDLHEVMPRKRGLTYHFITGNHDETFWAKTGVNVGFAIEDTLRRWGRSDWRHYGDRQAFLKVRGVVVELWHPRGSAAYAKSYRLQKHIAEYTAFKPQICLTGHFHQYNHCQERGVEGFLCPTFQGSGSKFSKSLGGNQAQGGLILEWSLTKDGTIRGLRFEKRTYYEIEKAEHLTNPVDGIAIQPVVTRPAPKSA